MRIVQIVTAISPGDAIGNDIRALDRMFREGGFQSEIYAETIDMRLSDEKIRSIDKLQRLSDEDIILYHACTATDLNLRVLEYGGKCVIVYHNITPPVFFEKYSPGAAEACRKGLQQIRSIADRVGYCIADSTYNREQLIEMGYRCPIDVCPVLIPFEDYRKEPDRDILEKYNQDGWINLLFVGRVVPNKGYQDILATFAAYHKLYNPKSRLFLVGNPNGMDAYVEDLDRYIDKLEIRDFVIFSGHVRFSEILAYYRLANVFVCMSAHEGFCVPLAEAMEFRLPIVAYDSSAISDTMGRGGILLDSTNPFVAAEAIHRLTTDERLITYIKEEQSKQLERFRYESVKEKILEIIDKITLTKFNERGEKTNEE